MYQNRKGNLWQQICVIAMLFIITPVFAMDRTFEIGFEFQSFPKQGSPQSHHEGIALSLQPSFTHTIEDKSIYLTLEPFFRWDQHDDERNHFDIRELKAIKVLNDWEFELGISKLFWGVAESNHLVDIINQTDFLEGLDGEDKLGQPLLRTSRIFDQSTLSLLLMPYFRERDYFGPENRFALPFPVNTDLTQFESSDEEKHLDYALRYSGYAGQMDYGVFWFEGTARDPQLRPTTANGSIFYPYYAQISRVGIDIQYTAEAWLWKLEAISEQSNIEDFSASVAGLEYTFYNLGDDAYDIGLLAEYNHDSRDNAQTVLLQNDAFLGTRLSFNDTESTALLLGGFFDFDDDSRVFRIEASRRVFEDGKLSLEAQAFSNIDPANISYDFRNNNFIKLEFSWFF